MKIKKLIFTTNYEGICKSNTGNNIYEICIQSKSEFNTVVKRATERSVYVIEIGIFDSMEEAQNACQLNFEIWINKLFSKWVEKEDIK